jgi:hypothetical protein
MGNGFKMLRGLCFGCILTFLTIFTMMIVGGYTPSLFTCLVIGIVCGFAGNLITHMLEG